MAVPALPLKNSSRVSSIAVISLNLGTRELDGDEGEERDGEERDGEVVGEGSSVRLMVPNSFTIEEEEEEGFLLLLLPGTVVDPNLTEEEEKEEGEAEEVVACCLLPLLPLLLLLPDTPSDTGPDTDPEGIEVSGARGTVVREGEKDSLRTQNF